MADSIVRIGRPRNTEDVGSRGVLTGLKASLMIPIVRIVKGVERPARPWVTRFSDSARVQMTMRSIT